MTKLPLFTNLPKKQAVWFLFFFIWLFFSMGPGLSLCGSHPFFVGAFPWLYLWELICLAASFVLIYVLCYKLDFCDINEEGIKRIIIASEEEAKE
jgi:uncharacterized membrane protein